MTPSRPHRHNEQGAALLTVLLLVAVLSAIAVAMLDDMRFAIKRQANLAQAAQADWYILGTEALARQVLQASWRANPGRTRLSDPWARSDLRFAVEGGIIGGRIYDASNCFNVNSLVAAAGPGQFRRDDDQVEAYRRLLRALGLNAAQAEGLADSLTDWIDSDNAPDGNGAEDYHYTGLTPPYRAANSLIVDLSELRAVRGYEAGLYLRLRPYLCAHPDTAPSPLNINTLQAADAPLLVMALGDALSLQTAQALIADRPSAGYATVEQFLAAGPLSGLDLAVNANSRLALSTRYFRLESEMRYHQVYRRMASVFRLNNAGEVALVGRHWGAPA